MAEASGSDNETIVDLTAQAIRQNGEAEDGDIPRMARQIVCLLVHYGKRPPYPERMAEVRNSYAGIADDEDLQADYRALADDLARAGLLNSVGAAVEGEIWRQLLRGQAMEAGA